MEEGGGSIIGTWITWYHESVTYRRPTQYWVYQHFIAGERGFHGAPLLFTRLLAVNELPGEWEEFSRGKRRVNSPPAHTHKDNSQYANWVIHKKM